MRVASDHLHSYRRRGFAASDKPFRYCALGSTFLVAGRCLWIGGGRRLVCKPDCPFDHRLNWPVCTVWNGTWRRRHYSASIEGVLQRHVDRDGLRSGSYRMLALGYGQDLACGDCETRKHWLAPTPARRTKLSTHAIWQAHRRSPLPRASDRRFPFVGH